MANDREEKLIESTRFRVWGHISSYMNGILVTLVVIPLLGWNLLTTQQLTVASAQDREAATGRLNAMSDQLANLFVKIDKMDDRVRFLEMNKQSKR